MLFFAPITLLFMIALSITVSVIFIILVVSDSDNKSQRTGVSKRRISRVEYIGKHGEREVNNILHRLDRSNYKIYHDLYIPTENNCTAQIDHIVTSPFGIFIVETKHFSGWIFGSERNQVIYKNRESFLNPIWQNAGHIKALENYLHVDRNY